MGNSVSKHKVQNVDANLKKIVCNYKLYKVFELIDLAE
jgi:hypothetical protein